MIKNTFFLITFLLLLSGCGCKKSSVVENYQYQFISFLTELKDAKYAIVETCPKSNTITKCYKDSVLTHDGKLTLILNQYENYHLNNYEYHLIFPQENKTYIISNIRYKYLKKPEVIERYSCMGRDYIESTKFVDSTFCTINGVNYSFKDNLPILK